MSLELALWAFGILTTVILSLVALLWRIQQKRLKNIEDTVNKISQRTDFVSYKAMDESRERAWTVWRELLEKKIEDFDERIRGNTMAISRIEGRLNGVK